MSLVDIGEASFRKKKLKKKRFDQMLPDRGESDDESDLMTLDVNEGGGEDRGKER